MDTLNFTMKNDKEIRSPPLSPNEKCNVATQATTKIKKLNGRRGGIFSVSPLKL
jgi:hypothetical protein